MRILLAATFFMLGLGSALSEQTFNTPAGSRTDTGISRGSPSSIDIDSASRADLRQSTAVPENLPAEEMPHRDAVALPLEPIHPDIISRQDSMHEVCNALFTAALGNGLPVQFFANLIYQESGLHNNTVSRAGALGIAQFMPATAKENGLDDPFDPHQAIPASAKLLQQLRNQFGNLGFAAAAYNAGPRRVSDWLASGHALPRETLDYVLRVTGRSAEQWRTAPPPESALTFRQELPCRTLPAFASLEESQAQEAKAEPPPPVQATASDDQKAKAASQPEPEPVHEDRAASNTALLARAELVSGRHRTGNKASPAKAELVSERHVTGNKASQARARPSARNIAARDEPGKRDARRDRQMARDDAKGDRGRRLADARESRTRLSSRSRSSS